MMEKEKLLQLRKYQCKNLSDLAKSMNVGPIELAEKTGYMPSTIDRVLSGKFDSKMDIINNIADSIGYTVKFVKKDK